MIGITQLTNNDLLFRNLTFSDIDVIHLLIEYRYKYDKNLFLGGDCIMQASDIQTINQEMIATYVSLDMLIKQCNFSEQQLKLLKMIEQGYTQREIENGICIENQNIKKYLKSIYKRIVKENEWQWRKTIYTNNLGLKTKVCSSCKEKLPGAEEFFSPKNDSKDLLHPYCRKCKK